LVCGRQPSDPHHLRFAQPRALGLKVNDEFTVPLCRGQPSDPHHLRFAQPRALGLKVSDEFTVPLCRGHHRQLHQAGNEVTWWEGLKINPLKIAKRLWDNSRMKTIPVAAQTYQAQAPADPPQAAPGQDAGKLPDAAN
jgi:hypothetical protein